jgi:uncharacterized protein YraI
MSKLYGFLTISIFVFLVPNIATAAQSFCAVTERSSDGFVNLRAGPGENFSVLGRVKINHQLLVGTEQCRSDFGALLCSQNRQWVFVEKIWGEKAGLGIGKGWIGSKMIRQISCSDD